jgi:hypothetical protein
MHGFQSIFPETFAELEYRYFAAEDPTWDLNFGHNAEATLAFGTVRSHAFSLAFEYRF